MALCQVEFKAPSIGKVSGMYVLLPELADGAGPFPVLYLLHGLTDNHTIWLRRTGLERYLDEAGLIVVMPDGHRSFYVNDPRPGGLAYEDHIVRDVVGFVDRTFPTLADREHRAIAGLSMGGYGAMVLGLRHPELFRAAVSHSGALGYAHYTRDPVGAADVEELNGVLHGSDYDCFRLAERLAEGGAELAIRFDCGTEDFLIEHNRDFHAHLERLGVAHRYEEYPGGHTWDYWDEHIQQTLAFVRAQFGQA